MSQPGLLTRERIIAPPGYNRWLVPPAALAVHLCIGMVYGLSVFWLPLSQAIGITHSVACTDPSLMNKLFTTSCDWTLGDLKQIFTLGILVLGASAAIWGGWLEHAGPRKAGLVAAICWPGGLALTALGVYLHQLWLMWLGGGLVGGVGLGLGYISPVSTLIKWFPDRRGLATGLAIMGFGGGAMIGAPLATKLMAQFRTPADVGVWQTLVVLAAIYAVFLTAGAFLYRVTPDSGVVAGGAARVATGRVPSVHVRDAHKTPQFWLLWAVLCLNVSAGIGVLEMASPMLQEIFGGRLIGVPDTGFAALSPDQHKAVAAVAAGFIGFLSLFNILGRFFWASSSDRLGRKVTFAIFFLLGAVLYAVVPTLAHGGHLALFAAAFAVVLSMYGIWRTYSGLAMSARSMVGC
jgi:MFS family permease